MNFVLPALEKKAPALGWIPFVRESWCLAGSASSAVL